MAGRGVSAEAVRKSAAESVRASAEIEDRTVDSGHVRSAEVERYVASHAGRLAR
jgi:hypothetical protein